MNQTSKTLGLWAGALIAMVPCASAQNLLGLETFNSNLVEINPFAVTIVNTTALTLAGQTVNGANGLSRNPETGVLYAIIKLQGQTGRELVTVNENTGVCTSIGNTGVRFSGITFTRNGTLYGVSGEGASPSETLYTLSLANGSPTLVLALGNGGDGEAIAYTPSDGRIYHASGFVNLPAGHLLNGLATGQIFESIGLGGLPSVGAQIFLSGVSVNEVGGLADNGNFAFYATDRQNNNLSVIAISGVRTVLGNLGTNTIRGLAYVRPANDNCSGATPIGNGAFTGNLLGATNDGDTTCGFGQATSPDVWFSYTASANGMLTVDTDGTHDLFGVDTAVDTVLSVHSGCPGNAGNSLVCDDDTNFGAQMGTIRDSQVQLALSVGQTVLIRVANYNAGTSSGSDVHTGRFNLHTSFLAIGPTFNEFCFGDGGNQLGCTNCPCSNNAPVGSGGGCLNSSGDGIQLLTSGDPSVSLPSGATTDLRFGADGAPGNAFCILNSGDALAPGNPMNPCFGLDTGAPAAVFDGLRCAIMNTRRHGGRSADMNGDVGVTNNPWGGEGGPAAGLAVAGGGFVSGQTRYFQIINRDDPLLSCMRGLNTSQAVEVTFTP